MDKPLFRIDFNKWQLLKDPESGLPKEPVPQANFDHFEYWSDEFNRPVRQVICKDTFGQYADYLDLDTVILHRRVSLLLGNSPYDDEIDKVQYEELWQQVFLKHRFQKFIDYNVLHPFQTKALCYYCYKKKFLIKKAATFYKVNFTTLALEETILSQGDIDNARKISEYEYCYHIVNILVKEFNLNIIDVK